MTYVARRYCNSAQWFSCRATARERVQSIVEKAVVRLNESVWLSMAIVTCALRIEERYGRIAAAPPLPPRDTSAIRHEADIRERRTDVAE